MQIHSFTISLQRHTGSKYTYKYIILTYASKSYNTMLEVCVCVCREREREEGRETDTDKANVAKQTTDE